MGNRMNPIPSWVCYWAYADSSPRPTKAGIIIQRVIPPFVIPAKVGNNDTKGYATFCHPALDAGEEESTYAKLPIHSFISDGVFIEHTEILHSSRHSRDSL